MTFICQHYIFIINKSTIQPFFTHTHHWYWNYQANKLQQTYCIIEWKCQLLYCEVSVPRGGKELLMYCSRRKLYNIFLLKIIDTVAWYVYPPPQKKKSFRDYLLQKQVFLNCGLDWWSKIAWRRFFAAFIRTLLFHFIYIFSKAIESFGLKAILCSKSKKLHLFVHTIHTIYTYVCCSINTNVW